MQALWGLGASGLQFKAAEFRFEEFRVFRLQELEFERVLRRSVS